MLRTHLAVMLLGTTLASAPALAQTNAPASGTSAANKSGQAETPLKAGQWRASKVTGLNVYNNNNEKIGDINELIVDREGKIEAVVIGVGGFLGMGEHDVSVPFSQVKWIDEPRSSATNTSANTNTNRTAGSNEPATTANPRPATNATGTANTRNDRTYPDHAMVNMTKDQLKALPEVRYSR
jgi:sporulation protein YlmC with PRC-barrel domain